MTSPPTSTNLGIQQLLASSPENFEKHLLAHWAYSAEFRGKLGTILHVGPFGQPYTPFEFSANELAYKALELIHSLGTSPTPALAYSAYQMLADQGLLGLEQIQANVLHLGQIMSIPASDAEGFTRAAWATWLKDKWAKLVITKARYEQWPADRLTSLLNESQSLLDSIASPEKQRSFSVDIIDTVNEDTRPRLNTRFQDLDRQLGGGLAQGDAYLVIGARSAGKTILGCNLATDAVVGPRPCRVSIVSTEMPAEQLYLRMVADMANVPYRVIEKGIPSRDPHNAEMLDRISDARRRLRERMRIYMWPREGGASAVANLTGILDQQAQEMGGLEVVVLDWIGSALGALEPDPAKVRMLMQITADKMAHIADDRRILTITTAQAHIDRGINKPWVDDTSLADCKQMGRNMVGVLGITALFRPGDAESLGKEDSRFAEDQGLCIGKARHGVGGYARVRRAFGFMRFAPREQ